MWACVDMGVGWEVPGDRGRGGAGGPLPYKIVQSVDRSAGMAGSSRQCQYYPVHAFIMQLGFGSPPGVCMSAGSTQHQARQLDLLSLWTGGVP